MSSSESRSENSDSVKLMAHALDQVLDQLPAAVERTDEVRRDVALFIVDHYRLGEHDPDRLSDLALAMLCPTGDEVKIDAPTLDAHKGEEPKVEELISISGDNELAPKA